MPDPSVLDQTGLIKAAAGPTSPNNSVTGYSAAQAAPTLAKSTGYTPTGVVVADDQTVEGSLNKIIAKDSPLMQQAAARAMAEKNNRGLINSSMAVGAGQDAVIGQALPIAQQDAQTRYNANAKTVDAQNAAAQFGAASSNTADLNNAQIATDVSKTNANAVNASSAQTAQAANQLQLQTVLSGLDANTKMKLAELDAQNKQLMQFNSSSASTLR